MFYHSAWWHFLRTRGEDPNNFGQTPCADTAIRKIKGGRASFNKQNVLPGSVHTREKSWIFIWWHNWKEFFPLSWASYVDSTLPYSFGQSNKTQKGYGSCHILPKLNKRAIQKFLRGSGGLTGSVPSVWTCMGIPEFPLSSDPLPFSPLGPLLIISSLQVPSCPSTGVPITSPHANKEGNMRCLPTIKEN